MWGFATVAASAHPGIPIGERVYGYLAPARYLVVPVSSTDINKYAFYVPRPHLPSGSPISFSWVITTALTPLLDRRPYNQFIRCATDSQYNPNPAIEEYTMLYRPLFWTSFWCADWLARSRFRGAKYLLISSASAKTAFLLAYCVRQSTEGMARPRLVGLTSARNLGFTQGLGLYDEVTTYDAFEGEVALKAKNGESWIYADVASNEALNARIFTHLGSSLVSAVTLGMTTVSASTASTSAAVQANPNAALTAQVAPAAAAPSAGVSMAMEPFFMVEWLAVRRKELSVRQIVEMQAKAWAGLMRDCPKWVQIERVWGGEDVRRAYGGVVEGKVGPERGFVWSLWEDEGERVAARL